MHFVFLRDLQIDGVGDWELFAASVASTKTRDMFLKDLAKWIDQTPSNRPLTDLYDTGSGE